MIEITADRRTIPSGMMLGIVPDPGYGQLILVATEDFFRQFDVKEGFEDEPSEGRWLARAALESFRTPDSRYFNCHTIAISGYGPIIYDAAIIMATKYGSGLVSSMCKACLTGGVTTTSKDAQAVYKFYYQSRPDVQKGSLTPNETTLIEKDEDYAEILHAHPHLFAVYTLKKRLSSLGPVWPGSKT